MGEVSDSDIIGYLAKYHSSEIVERLQDSLRHKSIVEILGVGRKEVCHSNFLAWLFNPDESHGLGMFPIRKLLLILATRPIYTAEERLSMPQWLQQEILSGNKNILSAKISTEVWTPSGTQGKDDGRVDIVIDLTIRPIDLADSTVSEIKIVVENKVFSSENGREGNQTVIYHSYFENNKPQGQHCLYTYLTPIGKQRCQDPHFIHITYQDILDKILLPATNRTGVSEHTRLILHEYIKNLSITMDSKNSVPMAISEEQRNLLTKFWDENQELILACIEVLSQSPECGMQDEVKNVAEMLNSISKNSRHNTKFEFTYNGKHYAGPWGQGRLVQNLIKVYAQETGSTFEQLEEVFPPTLQNLNKKAKDPYGCVRKTDWPKVVNSPERYFSKPDDEIELADGTRVVVCSQWGTLENNGGNFPKFCKHATDLGFTIIEVSK